ncbi:Rts2 protein [Saccharomycopsis crataegensis]|uniref:Rts2 protein n=1 Tax=Saccharomycopsis crataegensis TaxID=43959 RepID=A0AAV5QP70_9ASCO|nr:Rts2 protein [Saccharomycopsis crataegensis]
MAKAEYGTPKFLAKQMKAKGLQKLKFYCQVCNKQCRDANGFKSHVMSPSHTRKIQEIGTSKHAIQEAIDNYSRDLQDDFLRLLKLTHGTKKVNANKFYQEYISNDKDHIHLNSTRFSSLSSFIFHLEKSGKIEVVRNPGEEQIPNVIEDDESAQYNTQNFLIKLPDTRDKALEKSNKRQRVEKNEEELKMEMIKKKIEQDQIALKTVTQEEDKETPPATQESNKSETKPIKLSLKKSGDNAEGFKSRRAALGFKVSKPTKTQNRMKLK